MLSHIGEKSCTLRRMTNCKEFAKFSQILTRKPVKEKRNEHSIENEEEKRI